MQWYQRGSVAFTYICIASCNLGVHMQTKGHLLTRRKVCYRAHAFVFIRISQTVVDMLSASLSDFLLVFCSLLWTMLSEIKYMCVCM